MPAFLEIWRPDGTELLALESGRLGIGRADTNDIAVPRDERASRLHALIERLPAGWSVRDLGSTNGTFVNGERIVGDRALRAGDEIKVGDTRLVFRAERDADDRRTIGYEKAPELTPRERDVLRVLCRRPQGGDLFHEPASTRQVAAELHVSEAAVKAHLLKLYDKFGIYGEGERRRAQLANEAVRRGAVNLADLVDPPGA
ncbi:MAG: FHA domain-containing protein [Acidimicrobiia bacterium]|nr:FHA domain-containing protein [Acidimicrobiia bacterium]